MILYRACLRDTLMPRVLAIEREWFSELFTDLWALYQEGFRLVGEPLPVWVPDYQEEAA